MRLILHTAAYWLMWRIQQAIPKATALAAAEFATLRLRLLKVAARVIERLAYPHCLRFSLPGCQRVQRHRHQLPANSYIASAAAPPRPRALVLQP
jgi:hypothetical protein